MIFYYSDRGKRVRSNFSFSFPTFLYNAVESFVKILRGNQNMEPGASKTKGRGRGGGGVAGDWLKFGFAPKRYQYKTCPERFNVLHVSKSHNARNLW